MHVPYLEAHFVKQNVWKVGALLSFKWFIQTLTLLNSLRLSSGNQSQTIFENLGWPWFTYIGNYIPLKLSRQEVRLQETRQTGSKVTRT